MDGRSPESEWMIRKLRCLFGDKAIKRIWDYLKYKDTSLQPLTSVAGFSAEMNSLLGKQAATTLRRFLLAKRRALEQAEA